nr:T9SS type A sorting domain-containing protein [Chitinophagaceae bacterium]
MKIFVVQVIAILLFASSVFSGPPKRLIRHENYYNDTLAEYTHYYYKSYYGYNPTWEKVYDKNELRENFYLNLKPNNNLFDSAVLQQVKFLNPGNTTYYINYFDAFHRPILQIDSSTEQEITYKSTYEYTTDDRLSFYSNYSYSKWGKQGYFLNFETLSADKMICRQFGYYKTDSTEGSELAFVDTFYFDNDKLVRQMANSISVNNVDYSYHLKYNNLGQLKNMAQYRYYKDNPGTLSDSASYFYNDHKLLKERISSLKWDGGLPEYQNSYYYNNNYFPDSSYYKNRSQEAKYYYKYNDENYIIEKGTSVPTNPEVHFVEKFYYEPYYPTSTENADGLDDFYVVQNLDSRYIQIKANLNLESDVEIFMYNLEGKTVYSTHLASSNILNHSINKDGFSKGIFFIRVNTIQGSRVEKIFIN